jgi:hypothetical protein
MSSDIYIGYLQRKFNTFNRHCFVSNTNIDLEKGNIFKDEMIVRNIANEQNDEQLVLRSFVIYLFILIIRLMS